MAGYAVPFPAHQGPGQPTQVGYQYGPMPGQPQYPQAYQTQHQPAYQSGHNPGVYQQPHQASQYVQPGTVAYTASQAPNGGIVYQPVVAREVAMQTPQGVMKSIQYIPAGAPTGAQPRHTPAVQGSVQSSQGGVYPQHPQQSNGLSYGIQTSHMAFPTPAQAPPPGAMGHVPGVAYDMRTYGDAFGNGMPNPNSKEGEKERKRRLKEIAREEAREEKEHRKAMERATKKQQEWERGGRERLKAEDEEYRRRERDRHDSDLYPRDHGSGGRASGVPYPDMARPPSNAYDDYDSGLDDHFRDMSIGGGLGGRDREQDRGRKIGLMGRSHSRNASNTDVSYGGAAYGPPYNGGVPGGGEFNEPGYPGGGAYPRESKANHMNGPKYGGGLGVGMPGMPPVPRGGRSSAIGSNGVVPSPDGGIMPIPDRESHYGGPTRAGAATPYGGSNRGSNRSYPPSPARPPMSQMPPSPSPHIGPSRRSSTYGPGNAGLGGPPFPISGSGIPAGPGMPGTGMPGTGMPGSGMPGSGMPGGGIPGGGMPGGGMHGNGMPGGGMPGSGMPGGGMPVGGMMPGRLGSNVPGYSGAGPSTGGGYSQALAFEREPDRHLAYPPFQPFAIVRDMDELIEMLPQVPPLPAALLSHDVVHNDWARYMSDVVAAWKQPRSHDPHDRAESVHPVVSKWNRQFFVRRGVQFHVSKASKPRHGRSQSRGSHGRYDSDNIDSLSESDTEDSDISEDDYGAGYHEDQRFRQSARNKSKLRGHRSGGSNQVYHLTVEYVPQHGGVSIRKPAVGGYQGAFP